MNTTELYPKICEWLGWEPDPLETGWIISNDPFILIFNKELNFLHDRNQQKWIREKLKENGYTIDAIEYENYARIIITGHLKEFGEKNNGDLDLAFLLAVEQLIDKENETNKTKLTKPE